MPDEIPQDEKQRRAEILMDIQREISDEYNRALVGKEPEIMVDGAESGNVVGRTEADSPEVDNQVLIPVSEFGVIPKPGDFIKVKITSADPYDLYAKPS